jgi:hypothetical protein
LIHLADNSAGFHLMKDWNGGDAAFRLVMNSAAEVHWMMPGVVSRAHFANRAEWVAGVAVTRPCGCCASSGSGPSCPGAQAEALLTWAADVGPQPATLADALGFHHAATTRQHTNAGATWSQYTADRDRD